MYTCFFSNNLKRVETSASVRQSRWISHKRLASHYLNSMNLYCICVCPLTQIRQLESSLLYHIGKEKLGSKRRIWFWRPKSISPIKTSQTCQQKEKGPYPLYYSSTSASFGGKEKQGMTCTRTVRKPNSSNFHNPSTEE